MSDMDAMTAMRMAIELKRAICKEAGGPDDLTMMIHWTAENDESVIAANVAGSEVLPLIFRSMRDTIGPARHIVLHADSWYREASIKDGSIKPTERGQLQHEFLQGDVTVRECIMVHVATKDRRDFLLAKYTYDDDGMPIFSPIEDKYNTNSLRDEGWIPDCITEAFQL